VGKKGELNNCRIRKATFNGRQLGSPVAAQSVQLFWQKPHWNPLPASTTSAERGLCIHILVFFNSLAAFLLSLHISARTGTPSSLLAALVLEAREAGTRLIGAGKCAAGVGMAAARPAVVVRRS
jgi:hypothetical protein